MSAMRFKAKKRSQIAYIISSYDSNSSVAGKAQKAVRTLKYLLEISGCIDEVEVVSAESNSSETLSKLTQKISSTRDTDFLIFYAGLAYFEVRNFHQHLYRSPYDLFFDFGKVDISLVSITNKLNLIFEGKNNRILLFFPFPEYSEFETRMEFFNSIDESINGKSTRLTYDLKLIGIPKLISEKAHQTDKKIWQSLPVIFLNFMSLVISSLLLYEKSSKWITVNSILEKINCFVKYKMFDPREQVIQMERNPTVVEIKLFNRSKLSSEEYNSVSNLYFRIMKSFSVSDSHLAVTSATATVGAAVGAVYARHSGYLSKVIERVGLFSKSRFGLRLEVARTKSKKESMIAAKDSLEEKLQKNLNPSDSLPNEVSGQFYEVWFATNRTNVPDKGEIIFANERGDRITFGKSIVFVPRSHRIGSLGSIWIKRLFIGDDRITLRSSELLDENNFWEKLKDVFTKYKAGNRSAMIFIHGYNVTFEDAARRTAQLGCDLGLDGPISFFSWPSRGSAKSYMADESAIESSEVHLSRFLIDFADKSGADSINIIAHSMGNRGLLRALDRVLSCASNKSSVRFSNIILAAPDIDSTVFKNLSVIYKQISKRTTLYTCSEDKALQMSGYLHSFPRIGHCPPIELVSNIDTVRILDTDISFLGHSYFSELRPVLEDIREIIVENKGPTDRKNLRRRTLENAGDYFEIGNVLT